MRCCLLAPQAVPRRCPSSSSVLTASSPLPCCCSCCCCRDLNAHQDLGNFNGNYGVSLASHDSAFLMISW